MRHLLSMRRGLTAASLLAWIGMAGGCGPSLYLSHRDPTRDVAEIWVNGASVGQVRLGEEFSAPLPSGPVWITATSPGGGPNLWSGDQKGWRVVVENDVFLTLLTPAARTVTTGETVPAGASGSR